MTLKNVFNRRNELQTTPQSAARVSLVRRYVETGDERCPLAGIWSRLPELDALADEDDPSLPRPVMGWLLARIGVVAISWRAFHTVPTGI